MAAGDGNGGTISGINVTPLVDVMLVLLVIFMVTAPMMQQGVTVDLPQADASVLAAEDAALVVSVTRTGEVFLNDNRLNGGELGEKLAAIVKERPAQIVYLRADRDASYGAVAAVMAAVRAAGVGRLGVVTE